MSIKTNTTSLQSLLDKVNALPEAGGVELPELTNEGSASDLLSGKQLIDQDGNVVTGTIVTKTSSNLAASGATVTVPAGYYASQTTKSVATATQATPTISVNSSGLITASATQTAGYVPAGTKSATKQLTTQAAQTITPGTTDKTIASGRYLTGTQTIKGDANLIPANIISGKSIFGVAGTAETGSGSGETVVDDVSRAIITRTVTEISDDEVETIGSYAFRDCFKLTTASFPAATTISGNAFENCFSLATASFPAATTIGNYAFRNCYSLATFILAGSSVPTLNNFNAFSYTSMSTTGYFYVPSSLIASYQAATNWTYFSSRFSAVEDYEGWDGVYGSGT